MKVDEKDLRPIWLNSNMNTVKIIDQRHLPHMLVFEDLKTVDDTICAIQSMKVRGAPLIGATGAYGVFLAAVSAAETLKDDYLIQCGEKIKSARPTAVNLAWAVDRVLSYVLKEKTDDSKIQAAKNKAEEIVEFEVENCRQIGLFGKEILREIAKKKGGKVNVLTHCNAGWLACIEYGTATAPIYAAFDEGIDVHVWADETRPLNQGAGLTAWELGKYGVKHTVIPDNAGGHLMQHCMVDIVITGTDRTSANGDAANKIGTYLKALAARDNNIPFYVALPSSTFDWDITDGVKEIPIEERDPDEVRYVKGSDAGIVKNVLITPEDSPAKNYAFDVTPARLITGFITERGVCAPDKIAKLFPEKFKNV